MPIAALSTPPGLKGADAAAFDNAKSFRDADFMKIMLSELTQQDPFKPQETSKIVENVQKLQELANTRFSKFRDDLRFAQDVSRKEITIAQASISEPEAQRLAQRGLDLDRGFGQVTGVVESFRVVDEQVFVRIGDKDYNLDNLRQISPDQEDNTHLVELAQGLLGRQVGFPSDDGKQQQGVVTAVRQGENGVLLTVNGKDVAMERVTRIAIP